MLFASHTNQLTNYTKWVCMEHKDNIIYFGNVNEACIFIADSIHSVHLDGDWVCKL